MGFISNNILYNSGSWWSIIVFYKRFRILFNAIWFNWWLYNEYGYDDFML